MSVRVSLEEKEMRVLASAFALALTLTLFQYPERTKVANNLVTFYFQTYHAIVKLKNDHDFFFRNLLKTQ